MSAALSPHPLRSRSHTLAACPRRSLSPEGVAPPSLRPQDPPCLPPHQRSGPPATALPRKHDLLTPPHIELDFQVARGFRI